MARIVGLVVRPVVTESASVVAVCVPSNLMIDSPLLPVR